MNTIEDITSTRALYKNWAYTCWGFQPVFGVLSTVTTRYIPSIKNGKLPNKIAILCHIFTFILEKISCFVHPLLDDVPPPRAIYMT